LPEPPPRKVAAALAYPGHGAPKVVAAGKGPVAERILELAREAGVPTREDSALAQALAELELGSEIPPALYQAVAEALVWALRLDRSLNSSRVRL
jgi:flagellar biosynthesis protein